MNSATLVKHMEGKMDILLVEDNVDHAELTQRALEDQRMANRVHWAKDGQEALDYLFRKGAHASASPPGLILLDINLPKVSGLEVLKSIKSDERLRLIPVIMLTTSDRDEEVVKSYNDGANSFITKPVKFSDFTEKVKALKFYWLLTNRGLNRD
jgi:CheY-like chemotaxis protein